MTLLCPSNLPSQTPKKKELSKIISAMAGEESGPPASSGDSSLVGVGGQLPAAQPAPQAQPALEDRTAASTSKEGAAVKEDLGSKQLAAMEAVEKLSASKGEFRISRCQGNIKISG